MRVYVLLPELLIVAAAVGLLLSARLRLRPRQRRWLPLGTLAVVAAALVLELWLGAGVGRLFDGGWSQDRFALFAKAAILLALALAIAAADWELELYQPVLPLALMAAFGGMVAASATNLLGLWAGLELAALAGVVAASGPLGGVGGLRLLAASGLGSGLLAIGFGLLYAISGVSDLDGIRHEMAGEPLALPLTIAACLALAGAVLRLGLAPLQAAWLEAELDATPLGAGVLGGLVPAAAAVVLVKLTAALVAAAPVWSPFLAVLAAGALALASLRALTAPGGRPLVGWLAAFQAGWLAAGLAAHQSLGTSGALLLLAVLAIAATTAPVLLGDLLVDPEAETGAGLGRAQPGRAAALTVCLLSLAGVPPLAGFFGEFGIAAGLLGAGLAWVLTVGLLASVLALAAAVRAISPLYLEGALEETRRGPAGAAAVWAPGALAAGLALVALCLFANPISGLAFQGAEALGLR